MAVTIQGNTQVSRILIFNLTNWANISLNFSVQMQRTIYLSELNLMFRQLIPTNVLPISHRLFCQSMNAFHNYCCKFFMLFSVVFHSYDWPPWNVRQTFTTCRRNTIWIDGFFRIWLVFLLLRRVKKKRSSIQFIDPSQNANQLSLKMKKYVYLNEMAISFIFQFIQLVQSELDTHRNKKDSVVLSQCDLFRKNKFDIAY